MKLLGGVLGFGLVAAVYFTWDLTWPAVIGTGLVGVVLSQAMHATGWREVMTIAGTVCLSAATLGAVLLLLQLFMG